MFLNPAKMSGFVIQSSASLWMCDSVFEIGFSDVPSTKKGLVTGFYPDTLEVSFHQETSPKNIYIIIYILML